MSPRAADNRSDLSAATNDAVAEHLLQSIRQELKKEFMKPGKRPAMLAGSGFAAYMTLLFASIAVWWGLSNVIDQGWAALIVTVVWAVICAFLYVAAKGRPRLGNPKSGHRHGTARRKGEETVDTAWGRAPVS
jgi:fatty acid desaturase